jgi:hypothetical protein
MCAASTASCLSLPATGEGAATLAPNAPTKNNDNNKDYSQQAATARGAFLSHQNDQPVHPILWPPSSLSSLMLKILLLISNIFNITPEKDLTRPCRHSCHNRCHNCHRRMWRWHPAVAMVGAETEAAARAHNNHQQTGGDSGRNGVRGGGSGDSGSRGSGSGDGGNGGNGGCADDGSSNGGTWDLH